MKKPKSKAVRRIFGRRMGPQIDATSGAISDESGARQVTARDGGGEGRFGNYFTGWTLLGRYPSFAFGLRRAPRLVGRRLVYIQRKPNAGTCCRHGYGARLSPVKGTCSGPDVCLVPSQLRGRAWGPRARPYRKMKSLHLSHHRRRFATAPRRTCLTRPCGRYGGKKICSTSSMSAPFYCTRGWGTQATVPCTGSFSHVREGRRQW